MSYCRLAIEIRDARAPIVLLPFTQYRTSLVSCFAQHARPFATEIPDVATYPHLATLLKSHTDRSYNFHCCCKAFDGLNSYTFNVLYCAKE